MLVTCTLLSGTLWSPHTHTQMTFDCLFKRAIDMCPTADNKNALSSAIGQTLIDYREELRSLKDLGQ